MVLLSSRAAFFFFFFTLVFSCWDWVCYQISDILGESICWWPAWLALIFFAGFSLTLYHLNARLVVQLALWFIKTRFLSSHQLLADYCFLLLFFQEFLLFFKWFALACSSSKRAKPLAPEAARVWHRKIRKRACKNCSMKLVYPNELFKTNPASLPSVPKNQRYWDIVAGSHTLIC